MNKHLLFAFALCVSLSAVSQITTPVIKANFGVDGELRSNYNSNQSSAGNDDWFTFSGTTGNGKAMIDTTGAASIVSGYNTNQSTRSLSFKRNMSYPIFSVVNSHLLLDAAFVRDYHGNDSTVFASGSNKNGDSPGDWTTPVSQSIPIKNDILDMFVHVRRAGPNSTDSLWLFGGVSIDNTTGNRYFDFEMYQTDLTYNRSTLKFSGFGPSAGHTAWEFDAQGNIIKAGDIVFSAEYQSSSLSMVEARIWVNKAALDINPVAFSWSGNFDGATNGATFGYASITPKNGGTYYTGLQCGDNTWAGPFKVVLANDAVAETYTAGQFVEFSVNLTKLGLDPINGTSGSGMCAMPFKSLLVKTRSSSSFTAELKDFVFPFTFFYPAAVDVRTATPYLCESVNVAEISVTNPLSTSYYEWRTDTGRIVGQSTGSLIYADKPGRYIVTQYLQQGCVAYATDTVQLSSFAFCGTLTANRVIDLTGSLSKEGANLQWKVQDYQRVRSFEIYKSRDGIRFSKVASLPKEKAVMPQGNYVYHDPAGSNGEKGLYYRIALINADGTEVSSDVLKLSSMGIGTEVKMYPNPVKDQLVIQFHSEKRANMEVQVFNAAGTKMLSVTRSLREGENILQLEELRNFGNGIYFVRLKTDGRTVTQKITVFR